MLLVAKIIEKKKELKDIIKNFETIEKAELQIAKNINKLLNNHKQMQKYNQK